ncbi:MAG: DUF1311 domain-containing protein [Fibrobacteres bacterium]|nr:DUF1311 domain-containing protein [Fibrobacterota bacterium]
MKNIKVALVVALQFPGSVVAENLDPIDLYENRCVDKDDGSFSIQRCIDAARQKWEEQIPKAYKALEKSKRPQDDSFVRAFDSSARIQIKASQAAWEAYKEKAIEECDMMYDRIEGFIFFPMRAGCKRDIVKNRVVALRRFKSLIETGM